MNNYDGYIKGIYSYFADNHDSVKSIFCNFFKINKSSVKIAFRREDLELMVLVKLDDLTRDAIIMFTVNRLNEFKLNYDNQELLNNILNNFKIGSRHKKIIKIKDNISK